MSNHHIHIKYELLDPKSARNGILCRIVVQTIEKIIFEMASGGYFEFKALTELNHIFARAMGLNFLFNLHRHQIH